MKHLPSPVAGLLALASLIGVVSCSAGAGPAPESAPAPAAAWQPSPLFSTPWSPPDASVCSVISSPAELPGVDALLDPAALHARMAAAPEGRYALLEINFDTLGAVRSVAVLESDHSPEEAAALEQFVEESLLPQPSGAAYGVLLRASADGEARIGRQESCRPAIINREDMPRLIQQAYGEYRRGATSDAPPRPVVANLRVNETGRVIEARIRESSTHPRLDELMLEVAGHIRFQPAYLNRVPRAVWVQVPLRVQVTPSRPNRPARRGSP